LTPAFSRTGDDDIARAGRDPRPACNAA